MKFTKTQTEYDMKSIRFLLLTITTMFIIIGGLMIVLGISVYSHYHNFSFFYESAKSGRLFTPSVMTVLLGLMMLVVTSYGFFGSLKKSTCMVNTYAFILTLLLIIKLVIVVLLFTTDSNTIIRYIYVPVQDYGVDQEIEKEIDGMQISLNCCGGDSYLDYVGVEFNNQTSLISVPKNIDGDEVAVLLPESCCAITGDLPLSCTNLRSTGCKDALVSVVKQNAIVLGVLGVSVLFVQLLGITFSLLLARSIRKLKSEQALISWRAREQIILAREKEETLCNQRNHVDIDYIGSSHV